MSNSIIPYLGFGDFLLYQSEEEAKNIIKCSKWSFSAEVWDNKECTRPVPWKIIRVSNFAELFFANDKLFRICLCGECDALLPNGIGIGMKLDESRKIDPELEYNDWDEVYQSPQGYWLEDDIVSGEVVSISIFIREVLDEDLFAQYEW